MAFGRAEQAEGGRQGAPEGEVGVGQARLMGAEATNQPASQSTRSTSRRPAGRNRGGKKNEISCTLPPCPVWALLDPAAPLPRARQAVVFCAPHDRIFRHRRVEMQRAEEEAIFSTGGLYRMSLQRERWHGGASLPARRMSIVCPGLPCLPQHKPAPAWRWKWLR